MTVAVDTNVLIRLLTRDDEAQYQAAHRLFAAETIFIPTTVVLESAWVLRFVYDLGPSQIVEALRRLFGLPNVELENPLMVEKALEWREQGLDFADALHLSASLVADSYATYDRKVISKAGRLVDLPVRLP